MSGGISSAVTRLQAIARRPATAKARCELCSQALGPEHEHVVEIATSSLRCCCRPCAMLFDQSHPRFRGVPRDTTFLGDFQMTDAQWHNLAIPINLAFLFTSTSANQVMAIYPSPAGGTQSLPSLEAWAELALCNPVLGELASDVEALLVNRADGAREYYRAPIDECYKLVGLVRSRWRGFTGGVDLWREIAEYFAALKARSR